MICGDIIMVKLSICIPSVPSRIEKYLIPLMNNINEQIDKLNNPKDVELLVFTDNKRRSIGMKRQSLLDIASGKYICFIDDDDQVRSDYVQCLIDGIESGADVITFKQHVWLNQLGPFPLTFKLGHKVNEMPNLSGFVRPPWHVCAWVSTIAKQCKYSDEMYGEDWDWAKEANKLAKTSYHINKVLCSYIYSDTITEAK